MITMTTKKTSNKLDLEEIAHGIANGNEVGNLFFSLVNQKYDKEVSAMLCNSLRSQVNYEDMLDIFKSVDANNLNELVSKSCGKILKTVDNFAIKIHNEVKKYKEE